MRKVPDFNRQAFNKAERALIKKGIYATINPVTLDKESGLSDDELTTPDGLRVIMKRDLDALFKCDAIYMLDGWEQSEGAKIEHALAAMLSMCILYE